MYSTLINAQTLHGHLHDPDWRIVDCRFDLLDPSAGQRAYNEGHIPGALYMHLDRDLSSPITPDTGRHPLPTPAALSATFDRFGLTPQTQIVAYDANSGAFASRLWWLARWLGLRRVAVLDGGLAAWKTANLTLQTTANQPRPLAQPQTLHADPLAYVDADYVRTNLGSGRDLLLDARAAPRFRGEIEPIDPIAGHIPGARNLPQDGNLTPEGRFLQPQALRERFLAVIGAHSADSVIHYCGSGVTACHNQLAMEVAGLSGSRLYAGSWSEWIRDSSRPVARGAV